MHAGIQTVFLLLLLFVVLFAIVAQRLRAPYPIVLVVAGLLLSLVPGMPEVKLEPDVIFFIVLPLLLYWAAWHTSWRTLAENAGSISVLAVGLVIFTVAGVAVAAPLFLPGFDWRTGFLLGAVIAPTDAIAATSIARRLGLPKKLVDIIEGESLVNDATGLLAFQIGLALIVQKTAPGAGESALRFAYITVAGTVIGIAVAFLVELLERRTDDPPIVIALTVLVPFGAYFAAEAVHASGVLSVVACGLFQSRRSDEFRSARVRLEAESAWNAIAFIVNGLVFVLIGLQLPAVLEGLRGLSVARLAAYVLIFSAIVIGLRLVLVFPAMAVGTRMPLAHSFIIGWSSMRGVIALAAAMSVPETIPQRPMILFLTFAAIFLSLVLKGLTLPALIRKLGLARPADASAEEREARRIAAEAALRHLGAMCDAGNVFEDEYDDLARHYRARLLALDENHADEHGSSADHAQHRRELTRTLLRVERDTLMRLRAERRLSDESLRELLTEIDLAEVRAERG